MASVRPRSFAAAMSFALPSRIASVFARRFLARSVSALLMASSPTWARVAEAAFASCARVSTMAWGDSSAMATCDMKNL